MIQTFRPVHSRPLLFNALGRRGMSLSSLPSWLSPGLVWAILVLGAGAIVGFAFKHAYREQQAKLESVGTRIQDRLIELEDLNTQRNDHLNECLNEARTNIAKLSTELQEATRDLVSVRLRVGGLESDNTSLRNRIADLETQLDRQRARARFLERVLVEHDIPVPPLA